MEVTGVAYHHSPSFSPATVAISNTRHSYSNKKPNSFFPKQRLNRRLVSGCVVSGEFSGRFSGGFADEGHLKYYYNGPRMEVKEKEEMGLKKKEKEMKKKLKVLKGLSKNLASFSEMGFCLDGGGGDNGLGQQVKGQMISEATDVLLGQLQKLKEEKMEYKRIKKEEKAQRKASRMMLKTECKDSSSSSSSSSESDCDNVVNMRQLKTVATSNTHQEPTSSVQLLEKTETRVTDTTIRKVDEECGKKIEVCMGGKCKKSGAAMLLENFQKAVGGEAEVVGCKCMGKCRDGPNVMVRGEELAPAVASSMCIGVGLEDVDTIVTSFFGGSQRSCSDMVPALGV